jgi:glycosyltransferase involved in cell wall biosynthesis
LQHEASVLYVPPSDPQALATAVQRVLQDGVLRDRLQSNVNQTAKLYTWDRIAAQTLDVFKQVTPSAARKA